MSFISTSVFIFAVGLLENDVCPATHGAGVCVTSDLCSDLCLSPVSA